MEARLCVVMVSGEQVDCVAGGRLACRSQNGSTALLLACMNGHLAVARWLIEEKGVDYRAEKSTVSVMCFSKRSGIVVGWAVMCVL